MSMMDGRRDSACDIALPEPPLRSARYLAHNRHAQVPAFHGDEDMSTSLRGLLIGTATLAMLTACGGVSELTRQQVARSETAVRQAETAVGNSEAGALELQKAKDLYADAQRQLEAKNETRAQRLATQAELQAQLATAKTQNAAARRAADELLASIQTLREEAERSNAR
jgi:hypothetical protein